MRVKKISVKKLIFVFFLAGAMNFSWPFFPAYAFSNPVNFNQMILPARIVYLNEDRNIEKIWSNLGIQSYAYVLRFIDLKTNAEISAGKFEMNNYQKAVEENFSDNKFANVLYANSYQNNLSIDFIQNKGYMEEVHTYL